MKAYIALAIALVLLGIVVKDNLDKRHEIGTLKDSIKAYNEAEQKSIKTIIKVREITKDEDCYNMPLPDDVIKLLQH